MIVRILFLHFPHHGVELIEALIDGRVEAFFFDFDDLLNGFLLFS